MQNNHINEIMMRQFEDIKERKKLKAQYSHEWKITIFNTLGGAVAGLITSILFWLITK